MNFVKIPIDSINTRDQYKILRKYYFDLPWNRVYDFVEFIINFDDEDAWLGISGLDDVFNFVLKRESSAYRIIDKKIVPITSETEIREIDEAITNTSNVSRLTSVNIHLKASLDRLKDRNSPDYRNSIKESISAVEALCKIIASAPNATLGDALKRLSFKNIGIHNALRNAFERLYGYTNDAQGIRHALTEEPSLDVEDARFMLVSCSAFINYLISKANKAEII
jgi:hypothetical protein